MGVVVERRRHVGGMWVCVCAGGRVTADGVSFGEATGGVISNGDDDEWTRVDFRRVR